MKTDLSTRHLQQAKLAKLSSTPIELQKGELQKVEPKKLEQPDSPTTHGVDRARVLDAALSQLSPRLRPVAEKTTLGDALAQLESGGALEGAQVAELLFALRSAQLTRGDFLQLRKHILKILPKESAGLNKTKAALSSKPGPEEIVQLLLPFRPERGKQLPPVASLKDAQAGLQKLESARSKALKELSKDNDWVKNDPFFEKVRAQATETLAELEPQIAEQRAIVESFARWPSARFEREIARFRQEGSAVPLKDAGKLLYALRRQEASASELSALRDALLEGSPEADWPPSARVEPPTAQSLFSLMTGVEAPATIAEIDTQLDRAIEAGDPRAEALTKVRESLVSYPTELLQAPIEAFQSTGRGVEPFQAAILQNTLQKMELEPEQLARLKNTILEKLPQHEPPGALKKAIEELFEPKRGLEKLGLKQTNTAAALTKIFTGEVAGRPELPLERKQLTKLIAQTQGDRGKATLDRVRLLNGRKPETLGGEEQAKLARLDQKIEVTSARLDELKEARAGVNAVKGNRWLDQLEADVLVGGAVGIPGIFSGSAMAGVSVNEADRTTGMREKGVAAYVMPALSVGGYIKLDAAYTRAEGAGFSAGGGADFLGIWGGPGGRSWGNIFAGGVWIPQIINVGVGHGVKDGEAYGALILSTFWPPASSAAARVDTVVRHPGLALGAERSAELVQALAESSFVKGGKKTLNAVGGWFGDRLRPITSPLKAGAKRAAFDFKANKAAKGLENEAHRELFINSTRALTEPSAAARAAANGDAEKLISLHQEDIRRMLPALETVAEQNPEHAQTQFLLSAAYQVLEDSHKAVAASAQGLKAAQASGNQRAIGKARDNFMQTALANGAFEEAWPALDAWLQEGDQLQSKLYLVQWLDGQGRNQEAKQLAEGLAYENPRSFPAQRALADVTSAPPVAQVET